MDGIGPLVRRHRRRYGITLKELASKTDLSISFLSEIERGVAKPSMTSLRKIAHALGISLLSFSDLDRDPADSDQEMPYPREVGRNDGFIKTTSVVRAGRRKKLGYPDRPGFYELLTPDLCRRLEVLYVKIEPGFETGPEPLMDPPGEKFIYVLKGQYHITINGETNVLSAGDSIYYPASAPVFFKNIGDEPVELIFALTPPIF